MAIRLLFAVFALAGAGKTQDSAPFFRIQVVDAQTRRGVPLIELRMTDGASFVTDSAGVVAFFEPGLMGKEIFFHVSGHGYEHAADGFGFRGVRLTPVAGGSATLQVTRRNLAERLYRITGGGIYRDTRLLGETAPIAEPLLNGQVFGQDTAMAALYRGRIHWFWGDTNRPSYPLGNFRTSGATSLPPGAGGLDPSVGIDLRYFVGADGFCREMAPLPGPGVVWISGVHTAPDAQQVERMFAFFSRRQSLTEPLEEGLLAWDDATETFRKVANYAVDDPLHPAGSGPFVHASGGVEYLYFPTPYPHLRAPRRMDALAQPQSFEGYTPLHAGTRFAGAQTRLERDAQGRLAWGWKPGTPPLTPVQQDRLVDLGMMTRNESPFRLADADTGKPILAHNGTVAWNAYRQKWIMIAGESFGEPSFLGEVWYAEAAAIEGPWTRARKIVTHDDYSFYNVAHRPIFDQDGGRLIHFEGTYTTLFSGTKVPTPRYDYNQILYRLDLADPRLTRP